MARGPLYENNYRPQFSGHETFPLRYGWLKKAFDAVTSCENKENNKSVFLADDAIAHFGVGKNMVSSIRHWATAAGFIKDSPRENNLEVTKLGNLLLSDKGLDPFLEHPATLWLIHWHLSGRSDKTTWYWVFNHFHAETFEREQLFNSLSKLAVERSWRVAAATLKRDVECFVRTYATKPHSSKVIYEDTLESPLAELGLIKPIGRRDGFRLVRGSKASLGAGVFIYALIDFWDRFTPNSNTLSFEAIAHEPGSPGRVFLLGETDLLDILVDIDDYTNDAFKWSETAGLKQVLRIKRPGRPVDKLSYVKLDYPE